MLLPGCQCCGTCEPCTRTCTEPHTGTPFEKVYTAYAEGVEIGNPSDGYLTATGDNDTSDPYNGMDGTGPWTQRVGGSFTAGGSGDTSTRFPCTYRISFWRSQRQLGVVFPAPSTALTGNVIELTVTTGAIVLPDGQVITAADGTVTLTATVPLVSGGAGATDPRTNDGTVSFALQCQNVETTFSVQARITWNVQRRQHTLYGIVRECYEEGTPCATICGGTSPPNVVYLAVDNISLSGSRTAASAETTYVLERVPVFCSLYQGNFAHECGENNGVGWSLYLSTSMFGEFSPKTLLMNRRNIVNGPGGSTCTALYFSIPEASIPSLCAPVSASGTNGVVYDSSPYVNPGAAVIGSFDWSLFT
jgi:hypothetical protein